MALLIEVRELNKDNFFVSGKWEDGKWMEEFSVTREPGMTAAETVELAILELDMEASWVWSDGGTLWDGKKMLRGQFVRALGGKRVSESNAKQFDL